MSLRLLGCGPDEALVEHARAWVSLCTFGFVLAIRATLLQANTLGPTFPMSIMAHSIPQLTRNAKHMVLPNCTRKVGHIISQVELVYTANCA